MIATLRSYRAVWIGSCLAALTGTATLQAQSLPYSQDFQSETVGGAPASFTYVKAGAASGTSGPAINPATSNSTSGPVGVLIIDSNSTPVPAFADKSSTPAATNKAMRIYDYSTASSGTNQSAIQQVIPTVTSTSTQVSAATLAFDYQAPVTLPNSGNEYLVVAFGAYSTGQLLNSSGNRVIEFHISNDGTFSYSATSGQNSTLSSTAVPSGINRVSLFVNSHNSQVASYTINSNTYTLAPNSVDIWNYNYTTAQYTQLGSGLGMRNTGSYNAGADTELGIFGLFAAGSSSSGDVDFIIDNIYLNTLSLSNPVAPSITTQPSAVATSPGGNATFTVVAAGAPTIYAWSKDGVALANGTGASGVVISGATTAALTLTGVQAADAGNYTVTATNSIGSVTSSAAALTISAGLISPSITTQPANATVTTGGSASFTVVASGTAPLTYQWNKNGTAISGATSAAYTIATAQASDAASYTVTVVNSAGSVTSSAATLTVNAPSGITLARLSNFSGRGAVGTGENTLIVGFTFGGSAAKSVLVRGIGPGLKPLGVNSNVADPTVTLLKGSTVQQSNDNWDGSAETVTANVQAGAFPLTTGSLDAEVASSLSPGAYTAYVSGTSGIALAEVYEASAGLPDSNRFFNFSVRGQVGTGDNVLIAGFVVSGGSKRVLIRGVGPSLSNLGLTTALSDPQIALYSGSSVSAQNDNWDGAAATTTAFGQAGAFAFATGSKDAALISTLPPGAYTIVLTSATGTTGVAMIEVYELP